MISKYTVYYSSKSNLFEIKDNILKYKNLTLFNSYEFDKWLQIYWCYKDEGINKLLDNLNYYCNLIYLSNTIRIENRLNYKELLDFLIENDVFLMIEKYVTD